MENRFQIKSQTHNAKEAPPSPAGQLWDLAVVGKASTIDERSEEAYKYASRNAKQIFSFCFKATNELSIDGEIIPFKTLQSRFSGLSNILIEATTLSFPEIVYIVVAATKERVRNLRFVYVEPVDYLRGLHESLSKHRDFSLSDNRRFVSIPMFRVNLEEIECGQAVFFLGYEGDRLGQALEQMEVLQRWSKHVVFGVPAFEAAWEIDAIANNVQRLDSTYQIKYAAAASVNSAYTLLCKLRNQDKKDETILIAPFGTKPHTIATSLFLTEFNGLDLTAPLYDHPAPSQGRSKDIRRWHFYDVVDSHSRVPVP